MRLDEHCVNSYAINDLSSVFTILFGALTELDQLVQSLDKALRNAKEKEWSSKLQLETDGEQIY
jgi:hypothetical protein